VGTPSHDGAIDYRYLWYIFGILLLYLNIAVKNSLECNTLIAPIWWRRGNWFLETGAN